MTPAHVAAEFNLPHWYRVPTLGDLQRGITAASRHGITEAILATQPTNNRKHEPKRGLEKWKLATN